jgi:hypothetical protein
VKQLLPLLTAFAEGKELQFRINGGSWYPCHQSPDLEADGPIVEYREKPKPVFVHYRNYLISSLSRPVVYSVNKNAEADPTKYSGFVRWLDDDWQEVEV